MWQNFHLPLPGIFIHVPKWILFQVVGLKVVETCLFHRPPHMLGRGTVNVPYILPWRGLNKEMFTILRKILLLIPILALFQWSIWRMLAQSEPHSVFPETTCITLLKLSKRLSTSLTNKAVARYLLQYPPERTIRRRWQDYLTWFTVTFVQIRKQHILLYTEIFLTSQFYIRLHSWCRW